MVLIELISFLHLFLVVVDEAYRFMVPNNLYAICTPVIRNNLHVEIRGRLHKLIVLTIFEPVAFPAIIPPLNQ